MTGKISHSLMLQGTVAGFVCVFSAMKTQTQDNNLKCDMNTASPMGQLGLCIPVLVPCARYTLTQVWSASVFLFPDCVLLYYNAVGEGKVCFQFKVHWDKDMLMHLLLVLKRFQIRSFFGPITAFSLKCIFSSPGPSYISGSHNASLRPFGSVWQRR